MKIPVTCTRCGKRYEVEQAHAGKSGTCASCGQRMTIPPKGEAPDESSVYGLDETDDRAQPTTFTAARAGGSDEPSQKDRGVPKKTARRPGRRVGASPMPARSSPLRSGLVALACLLAVLVLVTAFVPATRPTVGRLIALGGLLVFLYGYGSGAYIAFTEDDLYGWLYVIFPPYAAYYFVSRWDEMSSRLLMVVVGLALVAGGGRLLEVEEQKIAPEEGAIKATRAEMPARDGWRRVVNLRASMGWPRSTRSDQLANRLPVVEEVHGPAVAVGDGRGRIDTEVMIKGREDVLERHWPISDIGGDFVRRADHLAGAHAAACHEGEVHCRPVVAARVLVDSGRAPELAPHDYRNVFV
jgi:DNA-directed RNA polymerase subunit RPC12/RpoP